MFTYHFVNFQVNILYIPSVWDLDQWMDGWPTVNFSRRGWASYVCIPWMSESEVPTCPGL